MNTLRCSIILGNGYWFYPLSPPKLLFPSHCSTFLWCYMLLYMGFYICLLDYSLSVSGYPLWSDYLIVYYFSIRTFINWQLFTLLYQHMIGCVLNCYNHISPNHYFSRCFFVSGMECRSDRKGCYFQDPLPWDILICIFFFSAKVLTKLASTWWIRLIIELACRFSAVTGLARIPYSSAALWVSENCMVNTSTLVGMSG